MPLLQILTNQSLDSAQQSELLRDASRRVAGLLGKPERYVMVAYEHNPHMLFAGTDAPLAYLELKSIGLPGTKTAELSKALCELMNSQLGVTADRVYIEFADAPRTLWGWDGGTF